MKIIGLDVGEKRIGVAKVDSDTRIAVPVWFVLADGSEWQEIDKIARLNNTTYFVLGLPRSNEGNETKQTLYVRRFAKTLAEKIPGAKVRFQDESLTSIEAEMRLIKRKKKFEKGEIDAEAASIILQDFVEHFTPPEVKSKEPTTSMKKEVDKAKMKSKKLKKALMIGSPLAIIVILLGITGVLKWRDYVRWQREQEYAEMEAAMLPDVFSFTIKPGETIYEVKEALIGLGYPKSEVEEAFLYDYSTIEGLEFLAQRPKGATLEGYLYGETYEFFRGTSAQEVLTMFLQGMGKAITENQLEDKYAAQGLTLFEGVTLASIVQKEAPSPEQPTVAQVFLTRLESGMLLGSDVTVSYALDTLDPDRDSHQDNQAALAVDSCYNTRLYGGLPCGPISNPGLSALLAVTEPSDTAYLYFLTGDDGVMYYSYTESEHLANAALHCAELCQISL